MRLRLCSLQVKHKEDLKSDRKLEIVSIFYFFLSNRLFNGKQNLLILTKGEFLV